MELNIPEVVAEVRAAFMRYEQALITNDVAVLDSCFWDSPHTIRYGLAENLYGIEAIRSFRSGRSGADLVRDLGATVVTSFGTDAATASTLYRRRDSGKTGRQMQTWIRMPEGWRVVAAHVSFLDYDWPPA
jgi:hypothetical protein